MDDLVQLAADVGPVHEQVGCLLVLDGSSADPAALADLLADRLGSVPRFRQVLTPAPFGCGPALWTDDPRSDPQRHVHVVPCPGAGDEPAMLLAARDATVAPLPTDRSPWRAVVLTGLCGGRVGVVLVVHHVLTDGIGGLAVLVVLADPARREELDESTTGRHAPVWAPRPRPGSAAVAREVWAERLRAVPALPRRVRMSAYALGEMRRLGRSRTSRCSLNVRTGPRRHVVVARADLSPLRAAAHAYDATVNDVVLAAVSGALRHLVVRRGEPVPQMTASVPVSRRITTTTTDLGNSVGGMVVPLAVDVDRIDRLRRTAGTTRERKAVPSESFEALVGPLFRLAARLHLVRAFVDHQRTVTTFVSDLAGPAVPISIGGSPVLEMLPVSHLTGNVTVTFAALSYTGRLVVTVTADPDACPDLDELARLLQTELDGYAALGTQVTPVGRRPSPGRSSGTPQ